MSNNVQRLGEMLAGRMKRTASAAVPTTLELGTINGNLSLSVDSIGDPIPQADYMVSLHLTHNDYRTEETTHTHNGGSHEHGGCGFGGGHSGGSHSHNGGSHDHRLPSTFRRLKAGDRVLVAWVGFEPVIIDIVVDGTTITKN